MSDALSFTEISGQHAELLPARTVMSMFVTGDSGTQGTTSQSTTGGTTDAAKPSGDGNPLTFLFSFAGKILPLK